MSGDRDVLTEALRALLCDWNHPSSLATMSLTDTIEKVARFVEQREAVLREHVIPRTQLRQRGLVVNGIEFIPMVIVERHLPFAVPPGQTVEAVFVVDGEA